MVMVIMCEVHWFVLCVAIGKPTFMGDSRPSEQLHRPVNSGIPHPRTLALYQAQHLIQGDVIIGLQKNIQNQQIVGKLSSSFG